LIASAQPDVGIVVVGLTAGSALDSGSFSRLAAALTASRRECRFAIANNASPSAKSQANALWKSECERAHARYGSTDPGALPDLLYSKLHEPHEDTALETAVSIVAVTVLCSEDLSVLGECGVDPRELADVVTWLPPRAILGFDVVHGPRPVPAAWYPELVDLELRPRR
jgi:hypothetical protein